MKLKLAAVLLFSMMHIAIAIDEGDEAPDFSLEKLSGGSVTLSNLSGKIVYIYWFGYN